MSYIRDDKYGKPQMVITPEECKVLSELGLLISKNVIVEKDTEKLHTGKITSSIDRDLN